MIIAIIAAMSRNRVIGCAGTIPWHIPEDRQRFRELTTGHTVIMGRKTFESIGQPLAGRKNIVVSRQPGYAVPGAIVASSLDGALRLAADDGEVFICGGQELYARALPVADRLYLTMIDREVDGDTFFPHFPAGDFTELTRERISLDPLAEFIRLERSPTAGKVERG